MKTTMKVNGSWAVSKIEYDDLSNILTITMVDAPPKSHGEVLRYANVPQKVWEEFQKAGSTGGYFNQRIRNSFTLIK